jgi:hypothetical protein
MNKNLIILSLFGTLFLNALNAQTNYAITMNGTNTSYVNLGTINPTNNFSSGITIECWVKWGSFNNWSRLADLGNGPASDNILFANQGTLNNIRYEVYQGGSVQGISGPSNLVTGRWYHVAVTQDASANTVLYVDGVSINTGTVWLPNNLSRTACYIGKSNWVADDYFNGSIDEMRIWNVARTQQQIKANMFKSINPATSGLVAYYHCNENGGSTLTNSTTGAGAGDGTTMGGLTWTGSPIIYSANALNFDGVNDNVVIPHMVSSDFTVEYWMKTSSTGPGNNSTQWYGGNGIVDAEVAGGTTDWGTSLTGSYLAFGIGNPDITIHSTSTVNTGNWVHVAATWKQSTGNMILYINGVQEATSTGSTALRVAPPRIMLGQLQTNIQSFAGTIDELRIWNVVRTQADIQAYMYNEIDPNSSAANNLLAYYTFNQNNADGNNAGVVTLIDQKSTNNGSINNFALSGTTSNFVPQQAMLAKLPVELISFTATQLDAGVQLQWETSSELNALHFAVERSADGRNWNSLTTIPAAGNSSIYKKYTYLDVTPITGLNYYRLRQTDINGVSKYSEIKSIKIVLPTSQIILLENPVVNGRLQIQNNSNVREPAALINTKGQLLMQLNIKPGMNIIDLSKYSHGIYWLKTADLSKKIIVQ